VSCPSIPLCHPAIGRGFEHWHPAIGLACQQRQRALGIGRAAFARDQHFRQRDDGAAGIGTAGFFEQSPGAYRIFFTDCQLSRRAR